MFFVKIAVVFLILGVSFAHIQIRGSCPNVTGTNHDGYRGSGLWYEYASTQDKFKNTARCIKFNMRPPKNGIITAYASLISKKTGVSSEVEAEVFMTKPDNKMHSTTRDPILGLQPTMYYYLEEVYDDYLITWTCDDHGSYNEQTTTIFTRQANPSTDVIKRAKQVTLRMGLQQAKFIKFYNKCY